MASIDDVKAAYRAIYRKDMSESEAAATARAIDDGATSLEETIAEYIEANIATTQPAIAVLAYVDGVVPTSAKITELATGFEVDQYTYYRDILGVDATTLAIAPYEATGRAVAQSDPKFKDQFAFGDDADFLVTNYTKIFGGTPQAAALANFHSQLAYFSNLYNSNGLDKTADLEARGAVLGQMIGYAFTVPAFRSKAAIGHQVAAFLNKAARGSVEGYGAPLPAVGVV